MFDNKRKFMALISFMIITTSVLSACSSSAAPTAAANTQPAANTSNTSSGDSDMDKLIANAKAEGTLTTIALPHDWCNYGEMISGFKDKYGIEVNELNPDAGSGDEIEAIKANKDNKGPQAPDVIDVGFGFGPQVVSEELAMPYKVSTWESIPDSMKNVDGNWYGDYYGVLAFEINKDVVKNMPQDWSDLLGADYKGQVALAGDPRTSNQAIMAVIAASLANGGSLDNAAPGLEFFKSLNAAGNFVPVIAKQATLAKGETPVVVRWDYLALSDQQSLDGNPEVEIVIPKSGVIGGVYIQAISAYAPHPNTAKLWMEYLYSDEGQLTWLKGGCHPARYNDLVSRNAIPEELAAKLPPADAYAKAVFPTVEELDKSKQEITENWDKVVGADVK